MCGLHNVYQRGACPCLQPSVRSVRRSPRWKFCFDAFDFPSIGHPLAASPHRSQWRGFLPDNRGLLRGAIEWHTQRRGRATDGLDIRRFHLHIQKRFSLGLAHRYPPNLFATPPEPIPPPVSYRPGCAAQAVTVPGTDGKDQTINMIRC